MREASWKKAINPSSSRKIAIKTRGGKFLRCFLKSCGSHKIFCNWKVFPALRSERKHHTNLHCLRNLTKRLIHMCVYCWTKTRERNDGSQIVTRKVLNWNFLGFCGLVVNQKQWCILWSYDGCLRWLLTRDEFARADSGRRLVEMAWRGWLRRHEKWKMKNEKWKIKNDKWKMKKWKMKTGKWEEKNNLMPRGVAFNLCGTFQSQKGGPDLWGGRHDDDRLGVQAVEHPEDRVRRRSDPRLSTDEWKPGLT